MPRPKSRTDTDIAEAALAVLAREGHAMLSMRSVARELGMSAMALYRYVDDRSALERLVADRLWASVELDVDEAPWEDQVVELVGRVRAATGAHPEAVPLLLRHRHDTPSSLCWIEAVLGILAEAGFHGSGRVVAQRAIVHFLVGAMQTQQLSSVSGAGTAVMAELPVEEFPHLVETAGIARGLDPDEEFQRGLASLLEGLRRERSR